MNIYHAFGLLFTALFRIARVSCPAACAPLHGTCQVDVRAPLQEWSAGGQILCAFVCAQIRRLSVGPVGILPVRSYLAAGKLSIICCFFARKLAQWASYWWAQLSQSGFFRLVRVQFLPTWWAWVDHTELLALVMRNWRGRWDHGVEKSGCDSAVLVPKLFFGMLHPGCLIC